MSVFLPITLEKISIHFLKYELEQYNDLLKLINFELATFNNWRKEFAKKENAFLQKQEQLKNKTQLTLSEQIFLERDVSELISAVDEDNQFFEEEVLQMLVIKLYTKLEILIKRLYQTKAEKSLPESSEKWLQNYKKILGIELDKIDGFYVFQTLRILNNNFKHKGSYLSLKSTTDIYKIKLLETIKDCLSDEDYKKLSEVDDENKIKCLLEKTPIKLELSQEIIKYFHTQTYIFLNNIFNILYPVY